MIRRLAQVRLRLIDAVALAAIAVLALKIVSLLAAPPVRAPSGSNGPGEQISGFFRAVANARTNYVPPDVTMTGAVPDKKAEDTKPEASVTSEDPRTKRPPIEFLGQPTSPAERALLERLGERREEIQQKGQELELRERLLENGAPYRSAPQRAERRRGQSQRGPGQTRRHRGCRDPQSRDHVRGDEAEGGGARLRPAADRCAGAGRDADESAKDGRGAGRHVAGSGGEAHGCAGDPSPRRGAARTEPGRGAASDRTARDRTLAGKAAAIEHDPEKWEPVFGKDHARTNR